MNEYIIIKVMNEATIKSLKRKGEDYLINEKIKKCLEDESFFFKIDKKMAIEILSQIGIKAESIENVYQKLINQSEYKRLINEKKIEPNDKNIIIKYN